MGWSIGYDSQWNRDIGYGVPAYCDHPDCSEEIDRGLAYVCCEQQPYGGDHGCGLFFCSKHHSWDGKCERCNAELDEDGELPAPFDAKPDHLTWVRHKLRDKSWAAWRSANPQEVTKLRAASGTQPGRKA